MSLIELAERFEATAKLTLDVDDNALVVEHTRLPLGRTRWLVYLVVSTLGLTVFFYLAYPFLEFPDMNGVWGFGPLAWVYVVFCMWASWFVRKGFYREHKFENGQVRILRSDYPNSPHKVPFIPRRIIVETTVPLIRGRLIISDQETAQTIRTGDSAPYVERYFVGEFLAKEFDAQFIAERELTDSETARLADLKADLDAVDDAHDHT